MAHLSWVEEDEWELVNDDGFVYKRKKRPHLEPSAIASVPPSDPAAEERNRRNRKKRGLNKLKERYQTEIGRWELLSNTLNGLNLQTRNLEQHLNGADIINQQVEELPGFSRCNLLDDLLAQLEAQEAMILKISTLCEAAEALCGVHEERSKQFFLDLPVWALSPSDLLNSLCHE